MACPQWPEDQLRDYLEALRAGVKMDRISDPHHVTSRGAGGGDTADNVMPLCRAHHNEWDEPFKGPSFVIKSYPRVLIWLQVAGRRDVLDRYAFQTSGADIAPNKQEIPMAKKTEPKVSTRPPGQLIDKEITFQLTIAQTAEKAQEMAALDGEIIKLELEKKEFDAGMAEKIKERYARMSKIAGVVREKGEVRIASVIMQKEFATNTVRFWHSEDGQTWDVVEERPMEDSERQMALDDIATEQTKPKRGKKNPGKEEPASEIADTIRQETSKKSKRSAVDGVYN